MANINLTAAVRSNLSSLQSTASLMSKTSDRLSTGNKVNSALDNPTNFFTAASLNSRAGDLNNLMDSMANGIKTIEAANNGITSITKLVESAQSTVRQALSDSATKTKPSATAATALATDAEADDVGKSLKEVAASKLLVGATAAIADSTTPTDGNVGMTDGDLLTVSVGNKSVTYEATATSTVQDFVDAVNGSGFATAEIGDDGALTIKALGSETLKVAETTTGTAADLDALGFGALDTAGHASDGVSSDVRTKLVEQFNTTLAQIDKLAEDAGFNGINLLNGDDLTVSFNERDASLKIDGNAITSASLGIQQATNSGSGTNFQNDADLKVFEGALKNALTSLRTGASDLGSKLSIVQTRQDFTKSMINTLETGASNLTLADMNQEAANMMALQTRQSLAQSTLSMANQADQGVLQLLR